VLLLMVTSVTAEMGDQWHAEGGVCTPLGVELPLGDPSR
jgi:hypothetical protein